jgi:hypothetical protein
MSEATPQRRREDSPSAEILHLLEAAFAPVDPPASLADELESRLASVQAAALEALEDWEVDAMRDPRNWIRPAAALAAGTVAGTALVVLRMRRARRQRPGGLLGIAEQGGKEVADAVAWTRARIR